jgi:hypothetical protein
MVDTAGALEFIHANARLVEQRTSDVIFKGADPSSVVWALQGYRNSDGGFGHGLEPDKKAPGSQPLDVEIAFERLVWAGAAADDVVGAACDWLMTVASPDGAVSALLPTIAGYPRAAHWARTVDYPPGVNPTAAIAAHVHALEVVHVFVDRASDYCFRQVESGRVPDEAHELLALSKLVEHAPDRVRAGRVGERVGEAIPRSQFIQMDPAGTSYGVTPLEFASSPGLIARSWFADDVIERHLVALAEAQQSDGGWPISWEPPSEVAGWEWRGIRTLAALRTLSAYGWISEELEA